MLDGEPRGARDETLWTELRREQGGSTAFPKGEGRNGRPLIENAKDERRIEEEGESNERRTKTADEETTVRNGRFFLVLSFHRHGHNSEEIFTDKELQQRGIGRRQNGHLARVR